MCGATWYVSNSGNRIRYDYDKLDNLIEKAYTDAAGKESAQPVEYTYDALGQRLAMEDSTGDTVYTYDSLGRLTSVTNYRRPETGNGGSSNTDYSHEECRGNVIGYTYDEADNLSVITYPDGTKVSYEYDLNGSLIKVTGRRGEETVYEYDALNRPVAEHRPNGISTYKVYNARNQITELTNRCDDCGWVLGHYVYTYDDRGYIVAEHAEEAREMDPYGRERYTPYVPEKQGENCDHGKNKALSYRLLVTDSTFTYDDAGKLLTAAETEAGCGTTTWEYSYDLMGNLAEKVRRDAKMDAVSSEKYVYNENNQLAEAVICDGKTTRKVQYTNDADGNLIQEYSPTDRSLTIYSYTVENRLEAVYTGNAYNRTLQMAAAYDGDGNRVYQLNYNPDKDEDFSDYYCSDNNCDYNGTGIQLLAEREISRAEKDLMALISDSGAVRNSQYELIEYLNDVNREYAEVLVEQNINGRVDTVYTYGNERISREMFNQTSRTAYYIHDSWGSVSGLTDAEGQLTKTYRYSANGELTYGGAKYENEYTYNGESYNPNIQSQYLRARYYSVVHASFLTEDSYLGNIVQPLTLNRYNYCISSWLNYVDPSGNYTFHQGYEAHRVLQEDIRTHFPNAETEYWVTNYIHSPSGKGRIDILLRTEKGIEVYEIKPAWQAGCYEKERDFIMGWQQRAAYIKSLENKQKSVVQDGTTLNSYVNGKELPIVDSYYDTATYFTVPGQPGMIYYKLNRNKKKDPEPALAMSAEKSEVTSRATVRNCEPIKVRQWKKQPGSPRKQIYIDQWPVEAPATWKQNALNGFNNSYDSYAMPYRKGTSLDSLGGPLSSWPDEKVIQDAARNTGIEVILAVILELIWEAAPYLL